MVLKISVWFWVCLFGGSLGVLFCVVGVVVVVFFFLSLFNDYVLVKFVFGVLFFFMGFLIVRFGNCVLVSELYYDFKYGEFILVFVDVGWEVV